MNFETVSKLQHYKISSGSESPAGDSGHPALRSPVLSLTAPSQRLRRGNSSDNPFHNHIKLKQKMLKPHKDPCGYKKLLAYRKAEELQSECRQLTAFFPHSKTLIDLADQMDRSARSGKQNIVEGTCPVRNF